jgi:inner membrane protein
MFIFAHVGITLGAATLVSGIVAACRRPNGKRAPGRPDSLRNTTEEKKDFSEIIGLNSLAKFLDIRLLILGSLFPDIIDKPLSFFGFGDGRSLTHTLLFTIIVLLVSLIMYNLHKKTWLLAIFFGLLAHLILDSMWTSPLTFLWPLYGWTFPAPEHGTGLSQIRIWWNILITNPGVDVAEAFGLVIILAFTGILLFKRKFESFALKGKI